MRYALLLAALLRAPPTAAQADPLYTPAAADIGSAALRLHAADIDSDGADDLVAQGANALALARSRLDGSFEPAQLLATAGTLSASAAADLDGDGLVDFAALSTSPPQLLRWKGNGTLAPNALPALTGLPSATSLLAADTDGDGFVDLVASSAVVLRRWPGGALFTYGPPLDTPISAGPGRPALGDVDADGSLDFAIPGTPQLHVWTSDASGTFATEILSNPTPSTNLAALALADLDLDGRVDLAAVDAFLAFLHVSLGDGSGSYGPAASTHTGQANDGLAVADLDGDGWPDLVSAAGHANDSGFAVLYGAASPAPAVGPAHGSGVSAVVDLAVGDFDGDARPDMALGGGLSPKASIHLNRGQRDFSDIDLVYTLAFQTPHALDLVDWNADGHLDAATTDAFGSIGLCAGSADGTLAPSQAIADNGQGLRLLAADLDNDGHVDFAQLDTNGALEVARSTAPGVYAPAVVVQATPYAADLAIGDLDLDGRLDLVASDLSGVRWFAGNGDATFDAGVTVALGVPGDRIASADFDLNGLPDLAALAVGTSAIRVAKATGAGSFGAPSTVAIGVFLKSFVAGHLDQDNKIDLVATDDGPDGVWTTRNGGSGDFLPATSFALPRHGKSPRLFDANADGFADLVYVDPDEGRVVVAPGNGLAQFSFALPFGEAGQLDALAVGDLDADGRCEIAGVGARLYTWHALRAAPTGTYPFGVGTPGCLGRMGLVAGSAPTIGNPKWDLSISNIGAGHGGFLALAFAPDAAGTLLQPFGILLHVSLAGVQVYGAHGSGGPTGRWKAAIPGDAALVGLGLVFQAAWPWTPLSPCDPSPFLLSTSRALAVTLRP